MKSFSLVVTKLISDIILIPFIFIFSYILKFKLGWIALTFFDIDMFEIYKNKAIEPYFEHMVFVVVIWIICLYLSGTYGRFYGLMNSVDEFIKVIKGISIALIVLIAVSRFYELFPNSKSVVLYVWGTGIMFTMICRLCINSLFNQLYKKYRKKCMIVGVGNYAQKVTEKIIHNKYHTYLYCGNFGALTEDLSIHSIKQQFNLVGHFSEIKSVCLSQNIQSLWVSMPEFPMNEIEDLIMFCEKHSINIHICNQQEEPLMGITTYEDLDGIPVISLKKVSWNQSEQYLKRFFDIMMCFSMLILGIPLWIMIATWIKVVSPKGPIFYKQERIGLNNHPFLMYKFRTMHENAEKETGPIWAQKNEIDRLIKGGSFLRRFSLDECPQIINIFKNEMSLIGPRPERPYFVEKISKNAPYFKLRHQVKGGLTGWAQIHGRAFLTNKPIQKFHYDMYYIHHWSFVLDIKIALKTVFIILKGEEAY